MKIISLAFVVCLAACGADTGGGTPTIDAAPVGVQPTFTSLYGDYFQTCKNCHAPGAAGMTSDTEKTLDFSTKAMAYTTLKGMASGLTGNFADCNGVPFIGTTPANSLVMATLDQTTRQAFDQGACGMDSVTDETVKAGSQPSAAFIAALGQWITAGAPNN